MLSPINRTRSTKLNTPSKLDPAKLEQSTTNNQSPHRNIAHCNANHGEQLATLALVVFQHWHGLRAGTPERSAWVALFLVGALRLAAEPDPQAPESTLDQVLGSALFGVSVLLAASALYGNKTTSEAAYSRLAASADDADDIAGRQAADEVCALLSSFSFRSFASFCMSFHLFIHINPPQN